MFYKDAVPASNILPRWTNGSLQIAPSVSAGFEMWQLRPAAGISIGSWSSASSSQPASNGGNEEEEEEKKVTDVPVFILTVYTECVLHVDTPEMLFVNLFFNVLLIKLDPAKKNKNKTKKNSIYKI